MLCFLRAGFTPDSLLTGLELIADASCMLSAGYTLLISAGQPMGGGWEEIVSDNHHLYMNHKLKFVQMVTALEPPPVSLYLYVDEIVRTMPSTTGACSVVT